MNNRIALVLKAKNISPSVLADELGVQRSGISHILNGRNKPSLEFIQKLIKLYPDISMQWILFGEGQMMNPFPTQDTMLKTGNQQVLPVADKPKPFIMELFGNEDEVDSSEATPGRDMIGTISTQGANNQSDIEPEKVIDSEIRKSGENLPGENIEITSVEKESKIRKQETSSSGVFSTIEKNKKPDQPLPAVRKISKIVVFYNDRTFIEYHPGDEQD